jgi:hypothetical protein
MLRESQKRVAVAGRPETSPWDSPRVGIRGGVSMPASLVAAAASEGRGDWLAKLPAAILRLQRVWGVCVGEPFQPGGQTAGVAPGEGTATN